MGRTHKGKEENKNRRKEGKTRPVYVFFFFFFNLVLEPAMFKQTKLKRTPKMWDVPLEDPEKIGASLVGWLGFGDSVVGRLVFK